ncbi:MAG TPA: protein kinase [Actinoplanes sp.]|nr:protein kinase [Actinoplanes sp.]
MLGGRYELVDQLGSGGMSIVWRARDTVLERTVAVKVLAGRHAQDPESRKRIRAEARAAATLSHPNIAHVYDYGESDENGVCTPYVVMELVRGGTLQQRLAAGPLPPRFAMRLAAEVAAALAAAHADGLVHRDIKPANVMVAPAGAKVVDFGIAAAISPGGSGESAFEVFGTPAYLAPERLTDDAVEPASDVYALGVLLYRLLSGHSPWSADTTTQMLNAHIYIEPEPLTPLPDVPDYVVALCNRCLSKDPTQRPSARDAAALLAQGAGLRVVDDEPTHGSCGPAADAEPSVLIRREAAPAAVDVPMAAMPAKLATAAVDPPTSVVNSPAVTSVATAFAAGALAARAGAANSAAPAFAAPGAGPTAGTPGAGPTAGTPGAGPTAGTPAAGPAAAPVAAGSVLFASAPAGSTPSRSVAVPIAPATTARRRRSAWLVAAVVLMVAGAALLWFLDPGKPLLEAAAIPPAAGEPSTPAPGSPGRGTGTPDAPVAATTPLAPTPTTGSPAENVTPPGHTPVATPAPTRPTSAAPAPTRGDPAPTTTAAPQGRTLSSVGGTVQAICPSPDTAQLLSWTATKPYKVKKVIAGPGSVTMVLFKYDHHNVKMTITCSGGVPSTKNDES